MTGRRAVTATARALLALGVALALADASVVTLALPEIRVALDTGVPGLAAVIGVYTLVLAGVVLAAVPLRRRLGSAALGAAGMALFAGASVACGLVDTLSALLAARAVQAVGAGAALVAAFSLLHRGGRRPDPLWVAGAVFGAASGPALGGALTELWDWRAIFLAQAPFGILAAVACLGPLGDPAHDEPDAVGDRSGPPGRGDVVTDPVAARPGHDGPPPPRAPDADDELPPELRPWPLPPPRPASSSARPAGQDDPTTVLPGRAVAFGDGEQASDDATAATQLHPGRGGAPRARRAPDPVPPAEDHSRADRIRAGVALALVSAALTAVVFLLVLLLVSGWAVEPLKAALGVSLLPVAAIAGSRIPGDPWVRACAGCGMVGAGILGLAALPDVGPWWVVMPQVLAGVGMGMCLPALAGELLPERHPRDAAALLSVRHVGITLALVVLAPVTAAQLDRTVDHTQEQITALVLDARLPPQQKLEVVGPALGDLDPVEPRRALSEALGAEAPRFAGDEDQAAVYARFTDRADDTLVAAMNSAFRPAFIITGILALLAALIALPPVRRHPGLAIVLTAAALGASGLQILVSRESRPPQVVIADPCQERASPGSGGLSGAAQDVALLGLDNAACRFGSSREKLVLAIGNEKLAREYEREHGVNPRSPTAIAKGVLGGAGDQQNSLLEVLKGIIGL
ncbi:MAG: MFS transporter [Solirubrobacteraceae bacterium]|nr:MFS transporter [Solirubrobacteraceae bacterium]